MSKRKTLRRGANGKDGRPSLFFIVVLLLGLIFLAMLFLKGIGRPAPAGLPGNPPAQR